MARGMDGSPVMADELLARARARAGADVAAFRRDPSVFARVVGAGGERRHLRVAIGDPQAPLERFLEILGHHRLLGRDGRLRPEVELTSLGDHFDYGPAEGSDAAAEDGLAILAWLAAHDADQVRLIAGNHDLARIGELAELGDDLAFAAARAEALVAYRSGDAAAEAELLARYPGIPTAEVLARDYACFSVAQRRLVQVLLGAGRFHLAWAAAPDLLLCHAGVTTADLAWAGADGEVSALEAATALERCFREGLERWDGQSRFELGPLYRPGSAAAGEGGGIVYHRPANPEVEAPSGGIAQGRRRFDPRTLPRGIVQVIGHIGDGKCRQLLGPWVRDGAATEDGPLRHLRTDGENVAYRRGALGAVAPEEAALLFADGGMLRASPGRYALVNLETRGPLDPETLEPA